jgi:predicted Rossmann fold nucleotide-binding protein DprA/Smf involved in DNA uptake
MANKQGVSGIADTIKARINQIEEQLKQHATLSDELERLRRALTHLDGEVRSRVSAGRAGRRPAPQPKSSTVRKVTAGSRPATVRAPRGENKAKILKSLRDGPKTASQVAKETGISVGTVSATLTKMTKVGELVKAERGYALPTEPTLRADWPRSA